MRRSPVRLRVETPPRPASRTDSTGYYRQHLESATDMEELLGSVARRHENRAKEARSFEPKLVEIDERLLDRKNAAWEKDKERRERLRHDQKDDPEERNQPELVIGLNDLGPPKSSSVYDFDPNALKQKAPLERFTTVPLESLPNLKSSPYSVKNAFPSKEYQEARMRARKAQTGITFFQSDEQEVTHAFPVLTAKETPKKKKSSHHVSSSPFSIPTIYESASESTKWNTTTPVKSQGNKITPQSSFSNLTPFNTDATPHSTPTSAPCTLYLEPFTPPPASTPHDTKRPESTVTDEDEEVHLYPVYQKDELEEISNILSNDAGLVSHWRAQFTENKAKLNSGLEEKLFKRHSDRDDVYHNSSMLSQAVSILLPSKTYQTKRKGNNIWKATKEKAQEDPSSFPSRKQFYQKLVATIQEFGGVRSDLDEQMLSSIRR